MIIYTNITEPVLKGDQWQWRGLGSLGKVPSVVFSDWGDRLSFIFQLLFFPVCSTNDFVILRQYVQIKRGLNISVRAIIGAVTLLHYYIQITNNFALFNHMFASTSPTNQPRKDPFHFEVHKSPFASVSKVGRGNPSIVSLGRTTDIMRI